LIGCLMISVRNIHKSFGSQVVLNGISFDIQPGKTTTVVGPSGVGKSVLLKLIMGILSPDAGEIVVDSAVITSSRSESSKNEIRKNLGVLFQAAALFDSLTVYDNVAFPLMERGKIQREKLSRVEVHNRTSKILQALDLEKHAFHYPEEISMGMRKKVGMARALITEPGVLLFDEPNTGLDPLVGQDIYELIKSCKDKWGFTGVVISHELPEVFQVSDKVVMLLDGKVVIDGTPQEIVESNNPAVQQFLHGRIDGPIRIQ